MTIPSRSVLIMMGTRCGATDPGVILYLMQEHGMNGPRSRTLSTGSPACSACLAFHRICARAPAEPVASEAISLFVYRIVRELGSLVAALGGIDALVFSGGIGEHDVMTRVEVVNGSRWIGAYSTRIAIPVTTSGSAPTTQLFRFGRSRPTRSGSSRAIRWLFCRETEAGSRPSSQ